MGKDNVHIVNNIINAEINSIILIAEIHSMVDWLVVCFVRGSLWKNIIMSWNKSVGDCTLLTMSFDTLGYISVLKQIGWWLHITTPLETLGYISLLKQIGWCLHITLSLWGTFQCWNKSGDCMPLWTFSDALAIKLQCIFNSLSVVRITRCTELVEFRMNYAAG